MSAGGGLILTVGMLGRSGFWDSPSSSGSGTTSHVLYVVNNNGGNSGGVVPFSLRSSGTLAKLSDQVAAGRGPSSIAITPNNTYLFVGNTDGGISGFGIASDAKISALSGSPFATDITPASLAIDSTGGFLYALDTTSCAISVYRIGSSTGALSSLQTVYLSSVATVSGPLYALRTVPHKKYLYVALGADGVWVYRIGAGGTLTFVTSITAPSGGQSMDISFDPQGAYAYVPDGVNSVWAYSVNQTGGLTAHISPWEC